jgi:hypothetical protein
MRCQFFALALAATATCLLAGCEPRDDSDVTVTPVEPGEPSAEDLEREAQEALRASEEAADAAADLARQAKDAYVASMRQTLGETNEYIRQLEREFSTAAADTRAGLFAALSELKVKRDAYEDEMDEIQDAGAEAWEQLKAGAATASDELKAALENAREQFTGDTRT